MVRRLAAILAADVVGYSRLMAADEARTAWLDRMYEEHNPELTFMNVQPRYDDLRGDPRFQQLLRKIGFRYLKFIPTAASD
jgi:hypothetical protein